MNRQTAQYFWTLYRIRTLVHLCQCCLLWPAAVLQFFGIIFSLETLNWKYQEWTMGYFVCKTCAPTSELQPFPKCSQCRKQERTLYLFIPCNNYTLSMSSNLHQLLVQLWYHSTILDLGWTCTEGPVTSAAPLLRTNVGFITRTGGVDSFCQHQELHTTSSMPLPWCCPHIRLLALWKTSAKWDLQQSLNCLCYLPHPLLPGNKHH